jgi:hypothetical protein
MAHAREAATAIQANPIIWFAEMFMARGRGDREREDVARQQLRELGIDVLIDANRLCLVGRGREARATEPAR